MLAKTWIHRRIKFSHSLVVGSIDIYSVVPGALCFVLGALYLVESELGAVARLSRRAQLAIPSLLNSGATAQINGTISIAGQKLKAQSSMDLSFPDTWNNHKD